MTAPEPYYRDDRLTLYHGDALEALPDLLPADVICTDPPWPGPDPEISGSEDPLALWQAFCRLLEPGSIRRLIVWLGCFTDPRFLAPVPAWLPFVTRIPVLLFPPRPRGHKFAGCELVYVFGDDTPNPGRRVLPGATTERSWQRRLEDNDHPCPRRLSVARFLVEHLVWPEATVIDPFSGSGTIPIAARAQGRTSIGIEIQERWCETTVRRLRQQIFPWRPLNPATGRGTWDLAGYDGTPLNAESEVAR